MKISIKTILLMGIIAATIQANAGFFDAIGDAISGAANVVRETAQGAVNVVRDVTGTQPSQAPESVVVEEEVLEPVQPTPATTGSISQPSAEVIEPSVESAGQPTVQK